MIRSDMPRTLRLQLKIVGSPVRSRLLAPQPSAIEGTERRDPRYSRVPSFCTAVEVTELRVIHLARFGLGSPPRQSHERIARPRRCSAIHRQLGCNPSNVVQFALVSYGLHLSCDCVTHRARAG